jgi:hypothetical protein
MDSKIKKEPQQTPRPKATVTQISSRRPKYLVHTSLEHVQLPGWPENDNGGPAGAA